MQVPRLTEQFTPTHYELSVTLERADRRFHGVVTIHGSAHKNGELRLHSKDLAIDSVTVNGKTSEYAHEAHDELVIAHPSITTQGAVVVVIGFAGTITDAMHGLYPCYFEHEGAKKELLATQFESHHAREVFPCIDEPAAKATFDVSLTTETGVTVLGNMPIARQVVENDQLVTTFETSPRMSSYLLAWVVGELHSVSAQTRRGVEVSVWATPAQPAANLAFALSIATRVIDFYEAYFGTEYPLPKSDHVALPDFSSGAMENWGLVTYREVALLADPATTSVSSRQYIATVIAHELAHQWFGNLVTMKWWNDLWLNESFATLMEYIAVDELYPEWQMWTQFSTSESLYALRRDALAGVQSVQVDVAHPDEISTLFDGAIVYAKGARLLRMLQEYVGEADFQAGLKRYFSDRAYQNAEAVDLWNAIDTVSPKKDLAQLMTSWLSQAGYPVVHATWSKATLTLAQEQFFIGPHADSPQQWPIPLGVKGLPDLLNTPSLSIDWKQPQLLLNPKDSAHFITHYDEKLLSTLLKDISAGRVSTVNRLQILHESTLLARGGFLSSADLLTIIEAYTAETTDPVWDILAITLSELRKFVDQDDDAEKALRKLSGQLARPLYERLGWQPIPQESEDDTKLRATIIGLMVYAEDKKVIAQCQTLYASTEIDQLEPELRPIILSAVVRYGTADIVDTLLTIHRSTHSSELQNDIVFGITNSSSPVVIDQLLKTMMDATIVRPQDAIRWFSYLIRGRYSRDATWQWLRDNWQWVEATYSGDKSYDYFPQISSQALSTRQQLEEYRRFFGPKKRHTALKRVITVGEGEIEGRVTLIERDGPAVRTALLTQSETTPQSS